MIGTGAHGLLPVIDEVLAEAKRRGVEVIAAPTLEVCRLLEDVNKGSGLRYPTLDMLTGEVGEPVSQTRITASAARLKFIGCLVGS